MGQKVNPHGLRVGVIKDWDSKWYAEGDFADYLVEDYNIRTFLKKKLYAAGVSKIEIERASDRVKVIIYTAKPGDAVTSYPHVALPVQQYDFTVIVRQSVLYGVGRGGVVVVAFGM